MQFCYMFICLLYIMNILTSINSSCPPNSNSITTVVGTHAPTGEICSGDLIFEDLFDTFDLDVWKHEMTLGGGSSNNQFQQYNNNRTNTYVQNGILHFKPTLLADEQSEPFLSSGTIDMNSWFPHMVCTNAQYDGCKRTGNATIILPPIKSARLNTVSSFAFKFGKVEVSAKISAGDWIWPACWLMPRWNQYGGWPASGEIDILESRGNRQLTQNGINIGVEQISNTLHWGTSGSYNKYSLTHFVTNNATAPFCDDFHKYQVYWTPDYIQFLIDDIETGLVTPPPGGFWEKGGYNATSFNNPWKLGTKMTPFDSEFFIIMNVAIGSTSFFSDLAVNSPYPKPWKNSDGKAAPAKFWNAKSSWYSTWNVATDDSHFQVDYIKVWAL